MSSVHMPHIWGEMEYKEDFWSELDEVEESVSKDERVVIGADFNGHFGEGNKEDEEVMGRYGLNKRNVEGQMVVEFGHEGSNDVIVHDYVDVFPLEFEVDGIQRFKGIHQVS